MKRKALGRGLSALIPDAVESPKQGRSSDYFTCPIERIKPNASQPRKFFDDHAMAELVASLREHGVVQPLVVRPADRRGSYVLIAGERRWRAAQKAGLHEVPVVIREVDDAQAFEMALVENIQREDLNPVEEAEAYQQLLDEHGYTQEEMASKVSKDRSTVANSLRLLKLPESARKALIAGSLSTGHARALLSLEKARTVARAVNEITRRGLSVRQTEALVRSLKQEKPEKAKQESSANLVDLQERLIRALKTRVRLDHRSGNKGRIEIHYNSLDELDRLLDILCK